MVKLLVLAAGLLISIQGQAQNKVDLEDLSIKGDLVNDNRLNLSNRDPNQNAERVTYRDNFRREVTDGLETPWPDIGAKSSGSGAAEDGQ